METFDGGNIMKRIFIRGSSCYNVNRPSHGVNNCLTCVSGPEKERKKQTTRTKTSFIACYTDVDNDLSLSLSYDTDLPSHSSLVSRAGAMLTVPTSTRDSDRAGLAVLPGLAGLAPPPWLSLSLSTDAGCWADAASLPRCSRALRAQITVAMIFVTVGAVSTLTHIPAAISQMAARRKKVLMAMVLLLLVFIVKPQKKLRPRQEPGPMCHMRDQKGRFLSELKMVSHTLPIPFYFTC